MNISIGKYAFNSKEQFKSNIYPCVTIEGKSLHKKENKIRKLRNLYIITNSYNHKLIQ